MSSATVPFRSPTSSPMPSLESAGLEIAARASKYWWLFLVSGVGWIVLSAVVFRFDYGSVLAVAILFGCVAIGAGVMEFLLAAASTRGWAILHALLGGALIAIGIVAFFRPGATFVGLAAVFSFYFMFLGCWDLAVALWTRDATSGWWVQALAGLIQLGLGFWAAGYWDRSAVLLVAFVAAMALLRGITQLLFAFRLHELHARIASGMT